MLCTVYVRIFARVAATAILDAAGGVIGSQHGASSRASRGRIGTDYYMAARSLSDMQPHFLEGEAVRSVNSSF